MGIEQRSEKERVKKKKFNQTITAISNQKGFRDTSNLFLCKISKKRKIKVAFLKEGTVQEVQRSRKNGEKK